MKILLDENLPKKLKRDLSDFEVFTVQDMGWDSQKNGVLLVSMLRESFDILITGDKGMEHQQNFETYPIPVILFNTHFLYYRDLKPLAPQIIRLLRSNLKAGVTRVPEEKPPKHS